MLKHINKILLRVKFNPWTRKRYVQRIYELLKEARDVLFVCKGNICRSPFAEHYAKLVLNDHFEISSCGYWTDDGKPSNATAQGVAQRFGVDLSNHRTKRISDEMINNADIIFTFDYESIGKVLNKYPLIKHKLYLLGMLNRNHLIINDPFGKSEQHFMRTYQAIAEAVKGIKSYVEG